MSHDLSVHPGLAVRISDAHRKVLGLAKSVWSGRASRRPTSTSRIIVSLSPSPNHHRSPHQHNSLLYHTAQTHREEGKEAGSPFLSGREG